MKKSKEITTPPIGFINVVDDRTDVSDPLFMISFTRWTGKEWVSYEPKDDNEFELLISGRINGSREIRNTF
ncbi:hypothetical protein KBC75_06075 [Candidatus Shapirobacteria bacterium]|nr:hypothetical protein [Candidatus Shapirobacteria bacterium]